MHLTLLTRSAMGLFVALLGLPTQVLAAQAEPLAAKVKPLSGEVANGGSLLQALAGLLVVLAVIVLLAWLLRRFGRVGFNSAGTLRVLGGLSMGARERIVLVQAGETQILLGVAPGRVQTLHVLDKPIEPDVRGGTEAGFADRLREVMKRGKP